ncbi:MULTISPECIES: hypothetical protein [Aerosakkonema]|uniref:hypothetical protein n=1 Tax=Aerosakkonema TaxID=1246629 RepID=UPI0035B9C2F4
MFAIRKSFLLMYRLQKLVDLSHRLILSVHLHILRNILNSDVRSQPVGHVLTQFSILREVGVLAVPVTMPTFTREDFGLAGQRSQRHMVHLY